MCFVAVRGARFHNAQACAKLRLPRRTVRTTLEPRAEPRGKRVEPLEPQDSQIQISHDLKFIDTNGMVLMVLPTCRTVLHVVLGRLCCGSAEIPSSVAPAAPDASLTRRRHAGQPSSFSRIEGPK